MKNVTTTKVFNEKGQTLIIIFVLMVAALAIGVAASSRFVKGIRNITQSDQSTRAVAVAEAAIEHLLLLPISTLEDYALNGTCTTDCYLEITGADGQTLVANVTLSRLGNSSDPYVVDLSTTETAQVNLQSYPSAQNIYICWDAGDMSVTGIYIHGNTGSVEADSFSYNPTTTTHADNNFSLATPLFGYANCITIASVADSQMLRLKSVYDESTAVVIPATGQSLPTQGVLIESTGVAGSAEKTVSVIITDPVLPPQFDYVIYQKSATEPLSN